MKGKYILVFVFTTKGGFYMNKKISKFEKCMVTIMCTIVLWATMFAGAYTWCYDTFDMHSDTSLFLAGVYSVVTGYWLIRKMVFRIINIKRS